jgi:hypothetical protein
MINVRRDQTYRDTVMPNNTPAEANRATIEMGCGGFRAPQSAL